MNNNINNINFSQPGQHLVTYIHAILTGLNGLISLIQEDSVPGIDLSSLSPIVNASLISTNKVLTSINRQNFSVSNQQQQLPHQQIQQQQNFNSQQQQQSIQQQQSFQQQQIKQVISTTKPKKEKRDPLAPKQPMTSYLLFCQDVRESIKQQNPTWSQRIIATEMGRLWKEISGEDRVRYDELAQQKRDEYNQAMVIYRDRAGIAHPVKKSPKVTPINESEQPSLSPISPLLNENSNITAFVKAVEGKRDAADNLELLLHENNKRQRF
ncbi:High mobility group B protein 4 [Clydaea vesicula]|uniref:High mobility group B protein 4 n=1 Tax=Clydaea vesicula TaxID=447962 RepID=A0AAD5U1P5_9FUNG|nr:High mobility group B protein 4 [Clydaea vesicula]KAJ3396585.1 High mobility group B protein 4 [Lobulomyces angularis]